MKAALPGTILQLQDDSWAIIPVLRAVSAEGDPAVPAISVISEAGGTATKRYEAWANGASGIKAACVGVLTVGDKKGKQAGAVRAAGGLPASIELVADPDAVGAKPLTHARLVVSGMAALAPVTVQVALTALGLELEPWAGGDREAALHSGGGLPDDAEVARSKTSTADVVGTGGVTVMRSALLQLLGVTSTTATPAILTVELATFLVGLTGTEAAHSAIALVLASSAAVVGGTPSAAAAGICSARAQMMTALNDMLGAGAVEAVMAPLQRRMDAVAASGFSLAPGGGGTVLRSLVADLRQQEMQRLLVAPPAPSPAPAALVPASAPGPPAPALAPHAAPSALRGFAALRPPPQPPAVNPLTDLALLDGLGGEKVAYKLARLSGQDDPLVSMTGNGSYATGREAAENFSALLDEARAAAPTDTRLTSTSAPVDLDEAGSLLRIVLGVVERARKPAAAPTPQQLAQQPSSGALGQPRDKSLSVAPKVVPASAPPDRVARACSAALLNPLCTEAEVRKAAMYAALADPWLEARRNIDLHGPAARAYLLSSGETNEELAGELPSPLRAARTALVAAVAAHAEAAATTSRIRESASSIQLISTSAVALDIKGEAIITHYGGLPPTSTEWRTSRELNPAVLGRWGTLAGPLALADAERAFRAFAPILVKLTVIVGGAPDPVDETLGTVPLVMSTSCLSDAARVGLLNEACERFALQHQLCRSSPTAPPADLEAIMLDASARAVKPISDHAASVEAGTRAGMAAAQAYFAGMAAKRPRAALAPTPAPAGAPAPSPAPSPSKKQAKKAAAAAAAAPGGTAATPVTLTGPAPGAAVTTIALHNAAAAGAAAAGLGASPAKVAGGAKLEPLTISDFSAKGPCLNRLIGGKGDSMVEVADRMHQTLSVGTPQGELPCGFLCTAGECKPKSGTCSKCAKGTAASAEVVAALKAAMTPALVDYLTKNFPGSPMLL